MMRVNDRPQTSSRCRGGAGFLRMAGLTAALGLTLALLLPAQAQFWSPFSAPRRPPGSIPQQPQSQQYNQQYNPFGGFFTPQEPRREAPVDYSHAPAAQPRHTDVAPTTPVVVVGDAMADWLAYGLEDAFADEADISIVRKPRAGSGLIRYDPRRDVDWAQTVREIIAAEKPKFIVMMIGTNDHQAIRDRAVPAASKPAASPAQGKPPAPGQAAPASPAGDPAALTAEDPPNPDQPDNPDQPSLIAPATSASGPFDFHTDQWEAAYIKRIDATIAAMKSAGVPVIWVGLPAQRGPKATSDASYLNELYRARAERAGIVYVDIWDGFVDEQGRYSPQGPDFEGQIRRLRSGDGVYFTKAGARKLAHYVEREIERDIANRAIPVALPVEPAPGARLGGAASTRPLAGPVLPLTVSNSGGDELLGGARPVARPVAADPLAARVLTKGEPIPAPSGRADDFSWPRGSGATVVDTDPSSRPSATPTALTTVPDPPSVPTNPPPPKSAAKPAAASAGSAQQVAADGQIPPKPKRPPDPTPPRPPAAVGPFGGLFH
jgi:uncharacterized protein